MALHVPNIGERKLLEWAIRSTGEALSLRLYRNDYTPVADSVASSFTVANFTGYSNKSLARATWSAATTNGDGHAEIVYPAQSWTASSSQVIYGYYVVGATSGDLIYAERFAVSRSLASGDTLTVTPRLTLFSA